LLLVLVLEGAQALFHTLKLALQRLRLLLKLRASAHFFAVFATG
jgi:hypothetical protein